MYRSIFEINWTISAGCPPVYTGLISAPVFVHHIVAGPYFFAVGSNEFLGAWNTGAFRNDPLSMV